MFYLTAEEICQQCVASFPGYRLDQYKALTKQWIWSALREMKTDRIGIDKEGTVMIERGYGQLPSDFLGSISIPNMSMVDYRIHANSGTVQCRRNGHVPIRYIAVPLDEDNDPLVLDSCHEAVMAWIDWKFTELWQRQKWIENPAIRPDHGLNNINRQRAYDLLGEARGELNMLAPDEVERLRDFMQNQLVYRNRYHG